MPNGYRGEGKTFSKKLGKWVKTEKEKVYDYDALSEEQMRSAALIISFFRFFPDYWYDLIRSESAKYRLELPQRLFLRIWARYRYTHITGARGIVKSYTLQLSKAHEGIFFPGEKIRYVAPAQKQSAKIASDAFATMRENYPLMAIWWNVNNDRNDMFRITTIYGSEFTMYAPRGDNCSAIVGEEIAAEGENGFDFEVFEADISPTCRLTRKVHGVEDRAHINLKESYISNASSRQNRAFSVYRQNALKDMLCGDKYDGYCMDISWISALLCNLRDIAYYKKERKKLTEEAWLREMCVRYTGSGEHPMVPDELLSRSRTLKIAELSHCGDTDAIYIISHDVAYADGRRNAKCADVVLKLTKYTSQAKKDKYRKQVVYVDSYSPLATHYEQAMKLKRLWERYCCDGAQTTYLVLDAQANGTVIAEELVKPTKDGSKSLSLINKLPGVSEIEQPNSLRVMYAVKSNGLGGSDREGEMITEAQVEFEQRNVELLSPNIAEGVEAYKQYYNIKDDISNSKIAQPYRLTDLLAQQIGNLRAEVSGLSLKEKRKSRAIQRDIWSALKYAIHFAIMLEKKLAKEEYRSKNQWDQLLEASDNDALYASTGGRRHDLLALRRR